MATQNQKEDNQNNKENATPAGQLTQKEKEMAAEQKGGQASKGGADQHGAHGSQTENPHGKAPSGQDGNAQSGNNG